MELQPELCVGSSRRVKIAKLVGPLRQLDPMGEGIRDAVLFLSAASLDYDGAPWVEVPRLGMDTC